MTLERFMDIETDEGRHERVRRRRERGCPHENTRLLSPSTRRLVPDGHRWLNTRPKWCSDCKDVVDRVPVE